MKAYYGCLSYYNNINSKLVAVRHQQIKSQLPKPLSEQPKIIGETLCEHNQPNCEETEYWFPKILHAAIIEYIYIPFNSDDKVYRN